MHLFRLLSVCSYMFPITVWLYALWRGADVAMGVAVIVICTLAMITQFPGAYHAWLRDKARRQELAKFHAEQSAYAERERQQYHIHAKQHHRTECECRDCSYGGCTMQSPCSLCTGETDNVRADTTRPT